MLYTCSLIIPAKKALGPKGCYQASLSTVLRQLQLDPKVSNMDAVLLGPNDMSGANKKKIVEAISNGIHPGICLMYMYTKESEAIGINIPYMKGVSRIKPVDIQKFVQESMEDFINKSGQLEMDPSVFLTEDKDTEDSDNKIRAASSEILPDNTTHTEEQVTEKVDVQSMSIPDEPAPIVEETKEDTGKFIEPEPLSTREEAIQNIRNFEDWNLLKEALERDAITKELMQENSEYMGTVQMLDVLDKKIQAIFFDDSLSSDKKFEEIKRVATDKTELKAVVNNITAQHVISIIDSVVTVAKRLVEEKLNSVNSAMAKMTVTRDQMMDTSKLNEAIQRRTDMHLDLLDAVTRIIKIYGQSNDLVQEEIKDMDAGLPSGNPFINNMLQPLDASMFTPTNTSKLVNDLMRSLQNNTLKLSAIEEDVQATIRLLCTAFKEDDDIRKYQQNLIEMMKAQRIEDIIVRDNILKYAMHVYVGCKDTGRTSTALTWSGILSHRHNTVLIDITGDAHYERYGIKPVDLNDFMTQRIEEPFLVVQSKRRLEPEEMTMLVSEIKSRLNYYYYVNVLIEPDDQNAVELIAKDALTLNFITDCTLRSINEMKACISKSKLDNVARKVIMIDAPISPLLLAQSLNIDCEKDKFIMLPYMKEIRACALKQERPYEHSDIVTVYENAFR